ncbi:hypothetical protein QJS10_CPA10g00139 [Acorus calamus]|uniref:Uncharacterized protein n=1 Tax=Acorus calamus TaxID=4465 RepID=A0AAV9E1L5_ACOCL|nr:hypothetical protein QJS10_CPA10g00139 [Acorus calamus]
MAWMHSQIESVHWNGPVSVDGDRYSCSLTSRVDVKQYPKPFEASTNPLGVRTDPLGSLCANGEQTHGTSQLTKTLVGWSLYVGFKLLVDLVILKKPIEGEFP